MTNDDWPLLLVLFSKRELRYVCYMLSPFRLSSVCDVGAPYSAGWNFRQFFSPYDSPGTLVFCCRKSLVGTLLSPEIYPAWGRGTPFRLCCSFDHSLPHLLFFITFSLFPFLIHFTYIPLLSIRSLSTRIAPLRFQTKGRRRRPNLGLSLFDLWLLSRPRRLVQYTVLPFTVLWLWYAPGSIVCRVCSTDAFTADVDYQLLIVCMVACRPEPDVLNFSHIVIDVQYRAYVYYTLFTYQHQSSASLYHPFSFSPISQRIIIHSTQHSTASRSNCRWSVGCFLFLAPPLSALLSSEWRTPCNGVLFRCCTFPLQLCYLYCLVKIYSGVLLYLV